MDVQVIWLYLSFSRQLLTMLKTRVQHSRSLKSIIKPIDRSGIETRGFHTAIIQQSLTTIPRFTKLYGRPVTFTLGIILAVAIFPSLFRRE